MCCTGCYYEGGSSICDTCSRNVELEDRYIKVPDGCTCDPREWRDPYNIKPICTLYTPADDEDRCLCCEHSIACHKGE